MTNSTQPFSRWWLVFGATILTLTVAWMNRDQLRSQLQAVATPTIQPTAIDALITAGETVIAAKPTTVSPYIVLASYYMQKVRETGDASLYNKVEELLDQATKIDPKASDIFATRGSVAAGRHQFAQALTFAQQAIAHNPDITDYLGLKADAEIELGRYNDATKTLQMMVDRRPDANVFTRIAYLREIYGDIDGAITVLETASSAASPFPENTAWLLVELGKLHLHSNIDKAKASFNQALALVPDYPPALKWLGITAAWEENYEQARQDISRALLLLPIAEYTADLGDLALLTGDNQKSAGQYALSRIAYDQSTMNGTNTDLEMAFFLADHNLDNKTALAKAQGAYIDRPNIFSADTLSWAWYQTGDFSQAQKYNQEALRLGEHDARIVFHAGMIAFKLQQQSEAKRLLNKALDLNPRFSLLQVRLAQETLQQLN